MNTTEQAQREKFEAWAEEAGALPWRILGKHRKQDGNYPGPHYTYMWKAWQAASAELVEELESAQRKIAELKARTVTVKFAPIPMSKLGNKHDGAAHPYLFGAGYNSATVYCGSELQQACERAGIKYEVKGE